MQKLKLSIIDRMIEQQLTSAEIDFMIYLSRYQDDAGNILGVYYRDVCRDLELSYQSYYNVIEDLREKGFIQAEKRNYFDWDMKILNNDFRNEDYKAGYINTNHAIFWDKQFLALKAGEKLLALQFLKISMAGGRSYNIFVNNFYTKYTELLGVTKRVISNYLKSLKQFFSIGIKEGQYWITPLVKIYKKSNASSESTNYNHHIGTVIFRRNKIKEYTDRDFQDTVTLLKQYKPTLQDRLVAVFDAAIKTSIEKANVHINKITAWKRFLQPKLIHMLMREEIDRSYV